MTDPNPQSESSEHPSRPFDGLFATLAWVVIILATLFLAVGEPVADFLGLGDPEPKISEISPDEVGPASARFSSEDDMTAKVVIAMKLILKSDQYNSVIEENAANLKGGKPIQQLGGVVLAAEVNGVEQGQEALARVLEEWSAEETNETKDIEAGSTGPAKALAEDVALIEAAFAAAQDGPPLDEATISRLEDRLGMFGRIAAGFSDPAIRKEIESSAMTGAITMVVVGLVFLVAGITGFTLLIVMLVRSIKGSVVSMVPRVGRHGIYIETFAIWLIFFFLLQLILGQIEFPSSLPALPMFMAGLMFFLSLGALAWPVVRGKTWKELRSDIGLNWGRGPVREIFCGVLSWSMALPLMAGGLLLTMFLMVLTTVMTGEMPQPSHPVQQQALGAGGWELFALFFTATVAAPVVEEILFRGVFYTHLRNASWKAPFWLSFLFSLGVSSFIFAAIHPQGLVFIPPLGGLAAGFCIAREWRGSLIPAIIAHALNNGIVMTVNVMLFT